MKVAISPAAASAAAYRQLFEANPLPMWVFDMETLAFLAVNEAAVAHYGYSRTRFLQMSILDIRAEIDQPVLLDRVRASTRGEGLEQSGVWRHRRADGSLILVEVSTHVLEFNGRRAKLVLAQDVTQRFEQERRIARLSRVRAVTGGISSAMLRLRNRDELLREACRVAVTEGVFPLAWVSALDPQTQEFRVVAHHGGDPRLLDFIGQAAREPGSIGARWRAAGEVYPFVTNDFAREPWLANFRQPLLAAGYRSGAAFPLFVEGKVVAVLVLLANETEFFDDEEIALLDWLSADLSFALEHIQKSQRLDYLAYYDTLTGLPNARLFQDRLGQFVQTARQERAGVCVTVLDLVGFTRINDTLGRHVGDELLRQVGARFAQSLAEPYALGRIGADTFAVASPRDRDAMVTRLRERLFEALKSPFAVAGQWVRLSAQAGIAMYPADGDDSESVFQNAEVALQLAKSAGEAFVCFSAELNARVVQRVALEVQLRLAVEQQQFVLHYQPRVAMGNGSLVGAEALIRWLHPQRGLVAPGEFISLAEETGLIVPIGDWVLDAVCAQQAQWRAAGLAVVPIAVNLSSVQFEKGDLLRSVRGALASHGLDPGLLDLELTESAVMNDLAKATESLLALRRLGVGLSLDDFGTGHSSLSHLKRFPFHALKIDRSFIADIVRNEDDAAIATAIIDIAHRLKLKVVAEGVETQGQYNFLRAHGCDEMQGHVFGPAMSAAEFESLLCNHKRMKVPSGELVASQTVMIVDDDPAVRAALVRVLEPEGYRLISAASGNEALALLAFNPVQVVISEQRMRCCSGTRFLHSLRELCPQAARILLSGSSDLALITDVVNGGAMFKFLSKPWDDDLLREQVREALHRDWLAGG